MQKSSEPTIYRIYRQRNETFHTIFENLNWLWLTKFPWVFYYSWAEPVRFYRLWLWFTNMKYIHQRKTTHRGKFFLLRFYFGAILFFSSLTLALALWIYDLNNVIYFSEIIQKLPCFAWKSNTYLLLRRRLTNQLMGLLF